MHALELTRLALEVITTLAAAAAAIAAWNGISTWKAQLRGTTDHDVARLVLREVYRLELLLTAARNPMSSPAEAADRAHGPTETPTETEARNLAHAYGKRLQLALDARMDLRLAELEVLALWGKSAAELLQPFHELTNKLASAQGLFFRDEIRGALGRRRMPDEHFARQEAVVWQGASDEDVFAIGLQRAVKAAEDYFRGFMVRGQSKQSRSQSGKSTAS